MDTQKLREKTNKHFRINIKGYVFGELVESSFIGFQSLQRLLTNEEIEILIDSAMESRRDIFIKKYRRGLTITLYSK